MIRAVFRRLVQGLITVLVLTTGVFFLTRATGNPAQLLLGSDASPADVREMTARLGLDRPLIFQYFSYIGDLLRGDLGMSLRYHRPTVELYMDRLWNTLLLSSVAILIALVVALPLGVLAGTYRSSVWDRLARFVAVLGVSAPSFWVGLVLMQTFAVWLHWLPAAGMESAASFVLPGFTLSLFVMSGIVGLLRMSMQEIMQSEFVRFARIKGVPETQVIWRHALRNGLVSVLSFAGVYFALLIGGGIVVETVFAWPGVGRLAYEGLTQRDFPVVQTVILMTGILIVIGTIVTDLLYSLADPRIKLGS